MLTEIGAPTYPPQRVWSQPAAINLLTIHQHEAETAPIARQISYLAHLRFKV